VNRELISFSNTVNRLHRFVLIIGVSVLLCAVLSDAKTRVKEWHVGVLQFKGNATFKSGDILELTYLQPSKVFKKERFSEWRLRSDVDIVRRFYRSQGFLENRVRVDSIARDTAKRKVDIVLQITEGPRTAVSRVSVAAADSLFDSLFINKLSLKNGSYLKNTLLNADIQFIKEYLAARGYLDSKVDPSVDIDTAHYLANVVYEIKEGPKIRVDSVKIEGLKKLKSSYVRRELRFKNGDILTSDRIRRSEQNLFRTNLLNSVQIEHEYKSADSVNESGVCDVTVSVTETNFFKLQTGLGYSYYGKDYKYYEGIRGHVKTSYSNLFGLGHQLAFNVEGAFPAQYADVTYSTPWFFNIPLQFASTFYLDRMTTRNLDSAFIRGLELSFNYQANSSLEYVYRVNLQDLMWFKGVDKTESPKTMTQIVGSDIIYDTRNDIVDPSKGMYNLFTIDVAGLIDKNSNRYIKVTDDFQYYWKFGKIIFGSGLHIGLIYAYDSSNQVIPPQEQFSLGGTKILRGYSQDELHIDKGVKVAANLLEIRFPIVWLFRGALFLDAGNVYELPLHKSFIKELKWSAGPGLRVKTPLAIIRMDIGFNFEKNNAFKNQYRLQLDIGQPF